jgi:hypothetical protein
MPFKRHTLQKIPSVLLLTAWVLFSPAPGHASAAEEFERIMAAPAGAVEGRIAVPSSPSALALVFEHFPAVLRLAADVLVTEGSNAADPAALDLLRGIETEQLDGSRLLLRAGDFSLEATRAGNDLPAAWLLRFPADGGGTDGALRATWNALPQGGSAVDFRLAFAGGSVSEADLNRRMPLWTEALLVLAQAAEIASRMDERAVALQEQVQLLERQNRALREDLNESPWLRTTFFRLNYGLAFLLLAFAAGLLAGWSLRRLRVRARP